MANSRRGRSGRNFGGSHSSQCRSDCCMAWLITIMKVIIIMLLLVLLIFLVMDLINIIKKKEGDSDETKFEISVGILLLAIISNVMLIAMVATEQACCICFTVLIMIGVLGWHMYQANKAGTYQAYVKSPDCIVDCVTIILMLCYSVLLCFG